MRGDPGDVLDQCEPPMVGLPPFAALGVAHYDWNDEAQDFLWMAPNGEPVNVVGSGIVDFPYNAGDVRPMPAYGDKRATYRYLRCDVTVATTAHVNPDGSKLAWSEYEYSGVQLPDHGGTDDRNWKWTFLYSEYDGRLRNVVVHLNEIFIYSWYIDDDGVEHEDGSVGPDGTPAGCFDMIQGVAFPGNSMLLRYIAGEAPGYGMGHITVTAGESTYEYSAAGTIGGTAVSTTVKIEKSVSVGYRENDPEDDPEDPEYVEQIITRAERELAKYDLSDLSKTYTFYAEPRGEAVTVRFKPHHVYFIYPFWKSVPAESGPDLVTKTMLWACVEPTYQMFPSPGGDPHPVQDGIWSNCGAWTWEQDWFMGVYLFNWVDILGRPMGTPIEMPPCTNRDIVRVGCARRSKLNNRTSADPVTAWGGGPMDPIFYSGALGGFEDYLESGKASVTEPDDCCLVQYSAVEGTIRGGSWSGVDNGVLPNIDPDVVAACQPHFATGSFALSRADLLPAQQTAMWHGVLFRAAQRSYYFSFGSNTFVFAEYEHEHWPLCCTEEVGLESTATDASTDRADASADRRPI